MALGSSGADGEEVVWTPLHTFIQSTQRTSSSMTSNSSAACDTSSDTDTDTEYSSTYSGDSVQLLTLALTELSQERADRGIHPYTAQAEMSLFFPYRARPNSGKNEHNGAVSVSVDSRTDPAMVYISAWEVLKRMPQMVLKRSKVTVPLFLRFLTQQYYVTMSADSEINYLHGIGLFEGTNSTIGNSDHGDTTDGADALPVLNMKTAKQRLSMHLEVFSNVTSPKGLYQHKLLFEYYTVLLSNSDSSVAKRAFDCMMAYKPTYLVSFKSQLYRLIDDLTIREELLTFVVTQASGNIAEDQRANFIPILCRILYGKYTSKISGNKQGKESSSARRAAILGYLSNVEATEIRFFVQHVLQSTLPRDFVRLLAEGCPFLRQDYRSAQNGDSLPMHEKEERWYVIGNVL